MKNAKRWLALLMAMSCVTASLAACGEQEEQKQEESKSVEASASSSTPESSSQPVEEEKSPFAGLHMTIWGPNLDYADQVFEKPSGNWYGYYAMEEWCLENDCTWEGILGNSNTNALMAAIAGDTTLDVYQYSEQFPAVANLGMLQPIDEYWDYFVELFEGYDIEPYKLEYKGHVYGISAPVGNAMMIRYDRTLFEDLGVKTPKEYFMEDNWTFETYFQTMREITRDTNGDGTYDIVGGTRERAQYLVGTPYIINDDGTISPNIDTQRQRDYWSEVYQLLGVEGVMDTTYMAKPGTDKEGQYHAMAVSGVDWMTPSNLIKVDNDGHVIEAVPLPKWKADDPEYYRDLVSSHYCVPRTAQNVEASLNLIAKLVKVLINEVKLKSDGFLEIPFTGLQGTLPETVIYNEAAKANADNLNATLRAMPEYDAEFIKKVTEYMDATPILQRYTFVNMPSYVAGKFKELWNGSEPAATAIAKATETAKALCDEYNTNYIY